ncbi:UNVERIFIED_CONTAM: hypothetical protein Slati_4567500 [Sesamum latifolium]|uniref:Uncharacterized protein n=1 Tax=Sesamum latifolium TaxID=2727402 RepID=A0AAW2SG40_9LAMI
MTEAKKYKLDPARSEATKLASEIARSFKGAAEKALYRAMPGRTTRIKREPFNRRRKKEHRLGGLRKRWSADLPHKVVMFRGLVLR